MLLNGIRTSTSRSEEHTSELQSQSNLVCRLLLEKKKKCASLLLSRTASPGACSPCVSAAQPQHCPSPRGVCVSSGTSASSRAYARSRPSREPHTRGRMTRRSLTGETQIECVRPRMRHDDPAYRAELLSHPSAG